MKAKGITIERSFQVSKSIYDDKNEDKTMNQIIKGMNDMNETQN